MTTTGITYRVTRKEVLEWLESSINTFEKGSSFYVRTPEQLKLSAQTKKFRLMLKRLSPQKYFDIRVEDFEPIMIFWIYREEKKDGR